MNNNEAPSENEGSSPFLQSPHPEDDIINDNNDNDMENKGSKNLQYQLHTLKNEFDIERMELNTQLNELQYQYKSTLNDLDLKIAESNDLFNKNVSLNEQIEKLSTKLKEFLEEDIVDIKQKKISDISNDQLEKYRKENSDLRDSYDLKIKNLKDQLESYKLDQAGTKDLMQTYENEITKQTKHISNLQQELSKRDEIIASFKNSNQTQVTQTLGSTSLQLQSEYWGNAIQEHESYIKELEKINLQQSNEIENLKLSLKNEKNLSNEIEEELVSVNTKLNNALNYNDDLQAQVNKLLFENERLQSNSIDNINLNSDFAKERNKLLQMEKNYELNIINLKKLNHEIEQQKLLSFEECKLLREELEHLQNQLQNNQNNANIKTENNTFKTLADDYKNRTKDLTNELKKLNDQLLNVHKEDNGTSKKRRMSDNINLNYSKRLNELQLSMAEKNKTIEDLKLKLSKLITKYKQLNDSKETKIRILQLRNNPVENDQIIKRNQLNLLKEENKILMEKLTNNSIIVDSIPKATYDARMIEINKFQKDFQDSQRKIVRLKEVYNKKSLEFIDVVSSILGFKLEFQHNKKVKMYSCFKPDKYLAIDLANNSLKSNLSSVLPNWSKLLEVWVAEKGQIPCFLAKITLQLYELSLGNEIKSSS
ncbi:hypothetical protein TBLA_0B05160 [Henningerozyma blattae CBS 6284]|uniref:Spindle assembly checkpoint component MAD1 n=1 Tax=Henningerozyma blattae (strain ATCC 34711 / CBS 6284 / DSM 70876 / NBRC 10599 / NRRL Y-10934 / UCD 77-7) TaxID=1071380 RepID=I2GYZ7_HENB6|nr:hypothetical protein TBLA_0B05160 [Tetrapisispora blattae CBS 6284]CCH59349.1 hypothetical protein TBLA_0B05160 [Tetrapisispora blattae CBS 6284]